MKNIQILREFLRKRIYSRKHGCYKFVCARARVKVCIYNIPTKYVRLYDITRITGL